MIKNLLLIILGIISLIAILNWLHIIGHSESLVDRRPECNDSKRYDTTLMAGGGTAITTAYAETLEHNFEMKYVDTVQPIKECYFSKKAIDHLFAHHPRANAIGCSFALENDSLKIIINSYRIAQTEIDIPAALDSTNILSKSLCPNTCPHAQ